MTVTVQIVNTLIAKHRLLHCSTCKVMQNILLEPIVIPMINTTSVRWKCIDCGSNNSIVYRGTPRMSKVRAVISIL